MKNLLLNKTRTIATTALILCAAALSPAQADVVKSGLCNENKIILTTSDNWYAAGIYVDGEQLNQGDRIKNDEVSLQLENSLELANRPGVGNYFIISINETLQEAEQAVCES